MRVADRVTDVTDRMQTRRLESKRESLGKDNDRLRTELRSTRDELERERRARDELLDALKKGEGTVKADKVKVKTKKRGGFLRLLIVGGGAYVLGTRAGRERYEQIKTWASDMKSRVGSGGAGDADEWSAMSNGGSTGMSGASGMSGSTGAQTGTGSTSAGSTSTGSAGSTSTTGSTGSTPGSSSSGGAGTGSSGSGTTGSTSGSSSTSKRSGSSGSTSGS